MYQDDDTNKLQQFINVVVTYAILKLKHDLEKAKPVKKPVQEYVSDK